MRKTLYILVVTLLFATLGCSDTNISADNKPESNKEEQQTIEYDNLWNVNIGVDDYKRNYASHHIRWESENGVVVSWSMHPIECSEEIRDDMETYVIDGATYYTKDDSICWDSYDLKGRRH